MTELILFIIAIAIASFIVNSLVLFFVGRLTSYEKRNIAIFGALIIIPTWLIMFYILFSLIDSIDSYDYFSINNALLIYFILSFLLTFFVLGKIAGIKPTILRILLIIINIGLLVFVLILTSPSPHPRPPIARFKSETSSSMTSLVAMCDEKEITLPKDTDRIDFVNIENQNCGPLEKGTFIVIAKWKMENKDCTATITETGASFFGRDC